MSLSHWASVLIAMLTLTVADITGTVRAEDKMPSTIDIVPRLRGKLHFVSDPVRVDNFPVPNFYIRGDFGEEKGNIYPVGGVDWSLRATPGVLPDKRLLRVGSEVRQYADRSTQGQLIPL